MEQTLGKSPALRESVMELYIEQKVDHENRPHFSLPAQRKKIPCLGNNCYH